VLVLQFFTSNSSKFIRFRHFRGKAIEVLYKALVAIDLAFTDLLKGYFENADI